MIRFTHPDRVGLIPEFLSPHDPRPAAEQFQENYAHGGGWMPFEGFTLVTHPIAGNAKINYPGDPAMKEVSRGQLRDELIIVFEYDWVCIVQPDGEYEISRMD